MRFKNMMILSIIFVFLLIISSVNAVDIDSNDTQIASAIDNDEVVNVENDLSVLNEDEGTYSDLRQEIRGGGNVKLTKCAYRYVEGDGDTIKITKDYSFINGNGAVIDMAGSNIRAFEVNAYSVTISNLTIKNAAYDGDGGAIYFFNPYYYYMDYRDGSTLTYPGTGTIKNCNFINNSALGYGDGGAVFFLYGDCKVRDCNFINNTGNYGGAVCFSGYTSSAYIQDSNFINNTARNAGAMTFMSINSLNEVVDCNFINNMAMNSGALEFQDEGHVTRCNFVNNSALRNAGAIDFILDGSVTGCKFEGNNALSGSAILFSSSSRSNSVSNSRFLNNRANADDSSPLQIVRNGNAIEITFMGGDNLLNAIYSYNDVSFTNVIYWGANGITNTGTSKIVPVRSKCEAGQNITVIMVANDVLVLNETKVTDKQGRIVLEAVAGNCTITARHDGDSYYTWAETTSIFSFAGNETKLVLFASERMVTAIMTPIVNGKIMFTVKNESGIVKTVESILNNGIANLNLTELFVGKYNISATYNGNISYCPSKNTITCELSVIKQASSVSANPVEITEGETATIIVNTDNIIEGIVLIEVNGNKFYGDIKDGKATVRVFGLTVGEYEATIIFPGNDKYFESQAVSTVKVNSKPVGPESKSACVITFTEIYGNEITGLLEGVDGKPIANADVASVAKDTTNVVKTKADGTFTIEVQPGISTSIVFAGDNNTTPFNSTITVKDSNDQKVIKLASHFDVENRTITIMGYAVDGNANEQGIYYATTLLDENGKPVSNAYIEFAVNNKIYKRTTYENGSFIPYKLNMVRAGRYTMAFNFAGNDNYGGAFACVCVDLDKKPITINAPVKSYKASIKTKKYTVSLSTIPSVYDGKVYLSPKKVTLNVNGKSYKGKTNNNGKITFKITNLNKKGKYVAKISFKGDMTYNEAEKSVKLTIK